jgi:uncharacterized protein
VCALSGYRSPGDVPEAFLGILFETAVFLNLLAMASVTGAGLYYLRTLGGKEKEIDFLLEKDGKITAIEVKHATQVGVREAENLFAARELVPGFTTGIVLYNGAEVLTLGKDIYAVPWTCL